MDCIRVVQRSKHRMPLTYEICMAHKCTITDSRTACRCTYSSCQASLHISSTARQTYMKSVVKRLPQGLIIGSAELSRAVYHCSALVFNPRGNARGRVSRLCRSLSSEDIFSVLTVL